MKQTACPICHEPSNTKHKVLFVLGNAHEYQIRECYHCKNIYTFFDVEVEMESFYEDENYKLRDTQKTIFYRVQVFEYKKVIHHIQKLIHHQTPSLLDFGSGKGLFLHFAKQSGFDVKGIETSLPRADYAREKFNLDINTHQYAQGKIFDTSFDVITCFHVLEHLPDPKNLLQSLVTANLKEEGLLLIEVPNFNSWQSKWAGKYWLHLDVPRHLSHFTPLQLKSIFEDIGYTIIKEEYFSFHLGIIGMMQTLFSFFGYRRSLIIDLKEKRSLGLLISIIIIFPFAFVLECIASMNKKGGIIRYYARKNQKTI